MNRAIITIAVVIGAGWLCETQAWGVTIPYVFVTDRSTVVSTSSWGGSKRTAFIEGVFELTVDFDIGIALFNQVDATLSKEMGYWDYDESIPLGTESLDVFLGMTQLKSTNVSHTQIDFLLERNIPTFPGCDVHLTAMFVDNWLEMTAYFAPPVYDGPYYSLDAVAVVVPEPGTLLLVTLGAAMLRRRRWL